MEIADPIHGEREMDGEERLYSGSHGETEIAVAGVVWRERQGWVHSSELDAEPGVSRGCV